MDMQQLAAYERRLPRYTSYPTALQFTDRIDGEIYRQWLAATPADAVASLYLHVPFCQAMCWYCGCNTTVAKNHGSVARYVDLLAREIDMVAAALPGRLSVSHVHWGGGTPNILTPDELARVMTLLRQRFAVIDRAEIAIELDPRTCSDAMVSAFAVCGFTRASLGVQDFDPEVQQAIHRLQPYEMTAALTEKLRSAGIGGINFDLIYGLPYQTTSKLLATVDRALALRPSRIALFGYAHVPWMKPHQQRIPEAALPGTQERAEQYFAAGARIAAAGYRRIGLDHYALADDPMAVAAAAGSLHRNFQGYTTDSAPLLIGLGASAIGSLAQGYVQNDATIAGWREAIGAGRFAVRRGVALSDDDRLRRDIIERLMCDLQIDLDAACARHGADPAMLDEACIAIDRLVAEGIGWRDGQRIGIPDTQRPLVRALCAAFDRYQPPGAGRHSTAI